VLPCLIFEDDHLLVVNKPAGLNTHAPSPYAGEGLYDWLRHREARWAKLAIIHRLDKETSGVMVFSKTPLTNRSLTAQFTERGVRKKYLLLTDRPVRPREITVESTVVRAGEKYLSRPLHAGGERAETQFRLIGACEERGQGRGGGNPKAENRKPKEMQGAKSEGGSGVGGVGCYVMVEAEPLTGRTHQIRVHAAEKGFPILGDTLYGGTPAPRVYLHAAELTLRHPASGQEMTFRAPLAQSHASASSTVPVEESDGLRWLTGYQSCLALREALIEAEQTNAYRVIHGASDGWPAWYVERLGDFLLSQGEHALHPAQREELARLAKSCSARGAYHKILTRHVRRAAPAEASPQLVLGEAAPERFTIRENGLRFELSFAEGYSAGLFLDQRDNRRRLLTGHVAAGFPLFPYSPQLQGCDNLTGPRAVPARSAQEHAGVLENPGSPGAAQAAASRDGSRSAQELAGALPQSAIGRRPLEILNTFAYTCGFSVCAAKAGARTTSLDLSKKCLDWGKRNFALNQLNPAGHDFIHGDAFDWLRRLAKKQRLYDAVLLDPPTFSQSKESGVFRADKDYGRLVSAALPLLRTGGVLFASTNAADWPPEEFLAAIAEAIHTANRQVLQRHYVPQPPDFPISRAEPAYLKTVWLRVA
jgi:23S rRNA G2069 N7-methylase RlmK/C1962 C5-methylase RlmI/23S rRNA-/tRNA-specific pseudouridylate synthase